jgi:uncharacterized membrane protein YhdT
MFQTESARHSVGIFSILVHSCYVWVNCLIVIKPVLFVAYSHKQVKFLFDQIQVQNRMIDL